MSRDEPVVLIVDRDPDTRDRVGAWLEDAGLDVLGCPGPTGPEFTCVGSRDGRCPLAEAADLVVLNPWLESDAAMLGTRAAKLVRHYRAWGKPVVMMTDRRDGMTEQIVDLPRRESTGHRIIQIYEMIRAISKDVFPEVQR